MVYDITKRNPDDFKSNTPVDKSVKIHSPQVGFEVSEENSDTYIRQN